MNPLLEIEFRIPFDQIRAEHVEPAIDQLLAESAAAQRELGSSTGKRTFENTLLALEAMTETLGFAMGVIRHLESIATYPELRAAYNAVQPKVSLFYTNIVLDPGLWRVLQEYAATPEAAQLTGTRKRFLQKTMDGFRRNGAELNQEGKQRLQQLDIEISQLTTKFSENVLDATNAFDLVVTDESRLAGLPESAVEAARESAKSKGLEGYRFTLQAPSHTAVMTYMDDRPAREALYRASTTRATSGPLDNREITVKIIELRQARAKLLGFDTFADLVLVERMAHKGDEAKQFLEQLRERTQAHFEIETEELATFRKQLEGDNAPAFEPWDVSYYAEKFRQHVFDFDEEALRPYFPLNEVVNGMFDLTGKLYGIKVVKQTGVPVWNKDVKYYKILDENSSETLGAFYADWFPREDKRGGAWMDAFLTGLPGSPTRPSHLGLICGNLTPPVGDKPSLLTHREVETVFHEFGHLLHHCLSRVDIRSLAGTNVAWDFVELPSQIMENWCWERQALDLFARHYQTGEIIPQDLYEKLKKVKTFRSASMQMRQLALGILDLELHTSYRKEKDGELLEFSRRIAQRFAATTLPDDYGMVVSFSHLFSSDVGYAAGYYSYKWAEVLEADAFTRFAERGIFSREVGTEFRDTILSRGDSEDPADLYRAFMGRDPDISALLKRFGLAA